MSSKPPVESTTVSGAFLQSGQTGLLKPSFRMLMRNWWYVMLWLVVLRLESTDFASSDNTSTLLYKISSAVFPHVDFSMVSLVNEVLRKTGHFVGYGILGVLIFLALKHTNRDRQRPAARLVWGDRFSDLWQRRWAVAGVLFTAVVAAADEIHQTFIPSRTGRWQDVVLDTCGAIVLQIVIYVLSLRAFGRRQRGPAEVLATD